MDFEFELIEHKVDKEKSQESLPFRLFASSRNPTLIELNPVIEETFTIRTRTENLEVTESEHELLLEQSKNLIVSAEELRLEAAAYVPKHIKKIVSVNTKGSITSAKMKRFPKRPSKLERKRRRRISHQYRLNDCKRQKNKL